MNLQLSLALQRHSSSPRNWMAVAVRGALMLDFISSALGFKISTGKNEASSLL